MEPAPTKPNSRSDSAILGILAGLGIGLAVATGCIFLFALFWGRYGVVVAIPFLLPPATVALVGANARRNKKPKFAAGLFIAAALVAFLEGTCATELWR